MARECRRTNRSKPKREGKKEEGEREDKEVD